MLFRNRLAAAKTTCAGMACLALALCVDRANANLPPWLQHVVGASTFEAALYRVMELPMAQTSYPRPPKEAQTELARLPAETSELYPLRARTDEAALDFSAAEADWKLAVVHAKEPDAARLDLANFYDRQLRIPQEIATLREVAAAPAAVSERFEDPGHQSPWQAFLRILSLIAENAQPVADASATYDAFLNRYPAEPAVYARAFQFQLNQKDYPAAEALLARFHQAFPKDVEFPIRARALLEYRRGNVDRALAVYDQAFEPLWPSDLIQSYLSLLTETHRQRVLADDARGRLAQHPDGPEALNALARIFYYEQQQGRLDAAEQVLDAFRVDRESRRAAWTADDLYTLAQLTDSIHNYVESARYDFALASSSGNLRTGEPAAQAGLSGLVHLLLSAPDQPIALGAGNLSLYRDIATLDQGPGYWNGILSLWLNGTSPLSEYNAETAKAQSYFHRAKAAELLSQLDQRFTAAPERPALHAELVHTYADYGEDAAVIDAGKQYLAEFSQSSSRVEIADLMADAYARQNNVTVEFALYDSMLAELSAKTAGQPLSAARKTSATQVELPPAAPDSLVRVSENDSEEAFPKSKSAAYSLAAYTTSRPVNAAADDYAHVLDRYLGRLVATGKLPQALALLRRQLDRNPDDPALYEKLASFLQQNNLSAGQEQVFKSAIARFQDRTWYDRLARFYLRAKNRQAFTALTRQVTNIFSGTELEAYFGRVREFGAPTSGGPQLALQLNLYAAKRFPHDLVFTQNLLNAYQVNPTANAGAYEALLRRHWFDSAELRDQFFAYLSRSNKLQAELAKLQELNATTGTGASAAAAAASASSNPAAARELGEALTWASHFEAAAPLLGAVAALYPAEPDSGDRAVSLFRSLSYLDLTHASLDRAVAIETRLLAARPDDPERLATLGDLYAEATSTGGEEIAAAAPSWRRIPTLHPGTPAGYLTSATVFWDYFQYDAALAELTTARTRFHQPALYGYEAGAIAENRHDMPGAVNEYIASATQPAELAFQFNSFVALAQAYFRRPSDSADSNLHSTEQSFFGSDAARARLLQLASRPTTKSLVDRASAEAVTRSPAARATITLRADVLTTQHRQAELVPLLTAALGHAATPEEAGEIGALAEAHTLPEVYEQALTRESALTADPEEKIELQYSVARSLESRKQIPAAARVIDSVYRANPRILGVVRATTDFYARTEQPKAAIATLLNASKAATPDLARSFQLEAAQRANDSGDTAQARALALDLLPSTPYDATVLGIIAASYASSNDYAGLKAFYLAELERARTDPSLAPDARKQDIALLRRGLVPALTRLQDYPAALDQYIALLSAYPEDSATAQEAALYALRNHRQQQLTGFLETTVKQSPKDSRFAVLLAQVQTTFDNLPAAVSAYDAAINIRKDRADLYSARVDLEVRLGLTEPARLERAAADFARLYLLTYKDPQWMVRLAELRARQRRPADAVKALSTAYIDGRPRLPNNSFMVAAQLEKWDLLVEAESFAQQGMDLAGAGLFLSPDASAGAGIYARIVTRLGHPEQVLRTLNRTFEAANRSSTFPSALATELAENGSTPAEIAAQRTEYLAEHRQTAQRRLEEALATVGSVVKTYYTPEQKLAYAQTLDTLHANDPAQALSAAASAGIADREAAWRRQQLLTGALNAQGNNLFAYTSLQQSRLAYRELAQTLEAYAARLQPKLRSSILQQAAEAYRDAGDDTEELRVTRPLALANDAGVRDRFLYLLLHNDRAALTALAAIGNDTLADAAVNYTVAHADQQTALAAAAQRARALPAVWRPATVAMLRTYFADGATPPVIDEFVQALDPEATIAMRVARPVNRDRRLSGDLWFYYAARFGEYLATSAGTSSGLASEDFLPAPLEQSPTLVEPYVQLARFYDERSLPVAATVEYRHALELEPRSMIANDELATVLYRANNRVEAIAQWRNAFAILRRHVETNSFPDEFYTGFQSIVRHLGERKLTAQFHPEIEAILQPYFARNGNYRSNEFLKAVYSASATPAEGTAFMLSLSNAAPDPELILGDLRSVGWLSSDAQQSILLRRLELARSASAGTFLAYRMQSLQQQLLELYLGDSQYTKAQNLLDRIPAADRGEPAYQRARILLAANAGRLPALLSEYRATPEKAPASETLNAAANILSAQAKPDQANARLLRESVFDQKQSAHTLLPTDFLALAQSRINTGDLPGALELLRRLTLQPTAVAAMQPDNELSANENPYANTDAAASLLEHAHHNADALPFLSALVHSVPWNASYRLRLAEAQRESDAGAATANLTLVAQDILAPYDLRVSAAKELAGLAQAPGNLGSGELTLLAQSGSNAQAARQPFFSKARVAAALAETSSADRVALLREAIAIEPSAASGAQARVALLLASSANTPPASIFALLETARTPSSSVGSDDADAANDRTSDADQAQSAPEDDVEDSATTIATLPSWTSSINRSARIRLAEIVASAYQRDDQLDQALPYLQLAIALSQHGGQADAQLIRRRNDLVALIKLEGLNARRRPVIHKELAQPGDVRPRLTLAELARKEVP